MNFLRKYIKYLYLLSSIYCFSTLYWMYIDDREPKYIFLGLGILSLITFWLMQLITKDRSSK